jgi:hypothetical protein
LCCEEHALEREEVAIGAAIQRLRYHISCWPFLSFLDSREPVLEPSEAKDEAAFRIMDCEDDCGPSAEAVDPKDRERAEQFKRDQVLPIIGWPTGVVK